MQHRLPERLARARALALTRAPYLAALAFGLVYVPTREVPTAAVDPQGRLYFHPNFVEQLPISHLATVLEHEWLHVARRHHERMRDKNLEIWNLAADAEINDDLRASGRPLNWNDFILPSTLRLPENRSAEQYYQALVKRGGGLSSPGDLLPEGLADAPPGLSREQVEILVEEVARAASKYPGDGAGRARRGILPAEDPPQIDWRRELREFFRRAVDVDFDLRRGFRRPLPGGVVLPRIAPRHGASAAVVLDTSGSMGPRELAVLAREILVLAQTAGVSEVHFIAGDTRVTYEARVRRGEDLNPHFEHVFGGGGTDMRPLIARAEAGRPDVIVVATDAYTPWPDRPPKVPLVVLLTPDGTTNGIPDWVRRVIEVTRETA